MADSLLLQNLPNSSALSLSSVVKEGWLFKRGEHIKNWRSRYFLLLEDGSLIGYKNKPEGPTEPLINFTVKGCHIISTDRPKPYTFILRGLQCSTFTERTFHVELDKDREDWVAAIQSVSDRLDELEELDNTTSESTMEELESKFEDWGAVLQSVSDWLDESEDVDMKGTNSLSNNTTSESTMEELESKLSVQGTSRSKSTGKKKVPLKSSFQIADRLYFVMEYVNGGELFFHLSRERLFSEDRTRFYGAEIISALGYLHEKRIIYRDLKLENLLLDKDGHIKIAHFGLCEEDFTYGSTTRTFCGTPAPEELEGDGYGRAVDWWGVGVVMYQMMCGRLPFYNRDLDVLYMLILMEEVEFPRSISMDAEWSAGQGPHQETRGWA